MTGNVLHTVTPTAAALRCVDCGETHAPNLNRRGVWRCLLCIYLFDLTPGLPLCKQRCPSCTVLQRQGADEQTSAALGVARNQDGVTALNRTMRPEDFASLMEWADSNFGGDLPLPDGGSWYDLFENCDPPPLVRAAIMLLCAHVQDGTPVALPPVVADIYHRDLLAFPVRPCVACGYKMPVQTMMQANNLFAAWTTAYVGRCPACGLDCETGEPYSGPASPPLITP